MDTRLVDRVHDTGNQGDMMLSELSQSQKTNTAGLHCHEGSKIVKLMGPGSSRVVARAWRGGSCCSVGVEFHLHKLRKFQRPAGPH